MILFHHPIEKVNSMSIETITPGTNTEVDTSYHIYWGSKKLSDRTITKFDDFKKAEKFFKKKEPLGVYIDVFEVVTETTTKITKLTSDN